MWRKLVAMVLALSLPAGASAGPLKEAAAKATQQLVSAQREQTRNRGRFLTGIALIGGGAVLASLGGKEMGGEDEGPNDPPEPSDGGEKGGTAMLAGGLAVAALGGVLLLTGRKSSSGPVVSVKRDRIAVRQVIRF